MPVRFYGHYKGTVRRPCGLPTTIARDYDHFCQSKIVRGPYDHCVVPLRGSYDVTTTCLRATGLRFFQTCHCAELNKIVEATMPVNPYDGRKVSLRSPHGNGDLDIVYSS